MPMSSCSRLRLRLALVAFIGGGCVPITPPFIADATVTHDDDGGADEGTRDASPWDATIADAATPVDARRDEDATDAYVADADVHDAGVTDAESDDAVVTDAARTDAGGPRVCGTRAFWCDGVAPSSQQPTIPETGCCCEWGLMPSEDDSCQ